MSRFAQVKSLDRCFKPITVFHGERSFVVPCGKCDACRLARANDWSFRVGAEIDSCDTALWFTLTYSNKYVPKLKLVRDNELNEYLTWKHDDNIRFDSVKDVLRDEKDMPNFLHYYRPSTAPLYPIENYEDKECITYLSKRDIQLFIKNVRQNLNELYEGKKPKEFYSFRYYIVGEYGPKTLRSHAHCIFFFNSREVAEVCQHDLLYKNWQMCDKALFDQYCRITGDGVANYVTEYVTSFTKLPRLFREKEIRPYRLASKSKSIGFSQFDDKKVWKQVVNGVVDYAVTIDRIDKQYLLRFPSQYIARLFPKCLEYSSRSGHLLLYVYGLLWHHVCNKGEDYYVVLERLRKGLHPLDYYATRKCFEFCIVFCCPPSVYLYFLDFIYYSYAIRNLGEWYKWQEVECAQGHYNLVMSSYSNFGSLVRSYPLVPAYNKLLLDLFLESFNTDITYVTRNLDSVLLSNRDNHQVYCDEVSNIVANMDKSKKLNDMARVKHY